MNPHHILLSTEDRRVIDDDRMSVERPNIQDWNLLIRHVAVSDNGQYTCHINTDPIQIKRVWLTVHGGCLNVKRRLFEITHLKATEIITFAFSRS